jgi:hypothetical protein
VQRPLRATSIGMTALLPGDNRGSSSDAVLLQVLAPPTRTTRLSGHHAMSRIAGRLPQLVSTGRACTGLSMRAYGSTPGHRHPVEAGEIAVDVGGGRTATRRAWSADRFLLPQRGMPDQAGPSTERDMAMNIDAEAEILLPAHQCG